MMTWTVPVGAAFSGSAGSRSLMRMVMVGLSGGSNFIDHCSTPCAGPSRSFLPPGPLLPDASRGAPAFALRGVLGDGASAGRRQLDDRLDGRPRGHPPYPQPIVPGRPRRRV